MVRTYLVYVVAAALAATLSLLAPPSALAATAGASQHPNWSALTPQQRQVLAPLMHDWDSMESNRQKKWLGVAARYHQMSPEQQQRVSAQMKTWAAMTPAQRNAARERFKKLNTAPPEQREAVKEKWQQYNQLPDSEKEKLKQHAARKKTPAPKGTAAGAAAPRPLTQTLSTPKLSGTASAQ